MKAKSWKLEDHMVKKGIKMIPLIKRTVMFSFKENKIMRDFAVRCEDRVVARVREKYKEMS